MKFGVFTVSMPEYSPEEAVQFLQETGYEAVEWRVAEPSKEEAKDGPYEGRYWAYNRCTLDVNNIEAEAAKAKALCDAAGLEITGLTTYLDTDQFETLEKVYRAAAAISCPKVRVGLVKYDPETAEDTYPVLLEKMRENLAKLAALSAKTSVKTVIEIHMNTLVSSPSAAYNALRGLAPQHIGVIFDPGNMIWEGFEEYRKSFELLGDYVAHVHIKNGNWVKKEERSEIGSARFGFEWTTLQEGQADLERLFQVMKQQNYQGAVSVEDFSNAKETPVKLQENLQYLRKLAKAAGM